MIPNSKTPDDSPLPEKQREKDAFPAPRIPVATYRLQFNHLFRFTDATDLVPYLHDLGISDVYASPYLRARKGSMHGYDIVDPTRLNPEVGTEEEYDAFVKELGKHGMGQVLDIVPNHMCCESDNSWWMDVLENGPCSRYAGFFDIDWNPAVRKLSGKLLIPILGDQYGKALENQELRLSFEEGSFFVHHYDQKFPVLPEAYLDILQHRQDFLQGLLCEENPMLTEFLSILTALRHLPPVTEADAERIDERYREKEIVKKRLFALYRESTEIRGFVDENMALFNGTRGDPGSFNLLDNLLTKQVWRLSYWRVATEEINYRRFFDINNISAIRMEKPEVFRATHSLVLRLVGESKVTGLRVDHADGLYNPSEYFRRLQAGCIEALTGPPAEEKEGPAPEQLSEEELPGQQYKPFYIVGEKILTRGEKMPDDWSVFGTTGYVFLNSLNGIFVDSKNARLFDRLYARFAGGTSHFADVAYETKKLVMQVAMSGEINTLGHYLNTISERNRHTRDFTLNSLTKAITEVIAFFPVYRTYIQSRRVQDRDRQYIQAAISKAKRKNPAMNASIFDFLGDVLLLRFPEDTDETGRSEWLDFVLRFQQITSPVMAKGTEDTAFYVYNRLVSLNEVGGSPDRFGQSLDAFHGQNLDRLRFLPHALNATSTHDTKRSEDVRARINVLSEIPTKWKKCITRWSLLNRKKKGVVEGQPVPDRNEEYLLYQTLAGAWPTAAEATQQGEFVQRIKEYMVKALREAKVNTSWISQNIQYEEAVLSFIDGILSDGPGNRFLDEFLPFQKTVSYFGMINSLSQALLKVASPGVPDIYQGTEIWNFSLVDPDNRRPVDFGRVGLILRELKEKAARAGGDLAGLAGELFQNMEDGRIKLYVTRMALNFRKEHDSLFSKGAYVPLKCEGELKDNICSFVRMEGDEAVFVVTPRFIAGLSGLESGMPFGEKAWGKTYIVLAEEVRGRIFRNVFTGEKVKTGLRDEKRILAAAEVFSCFPVAMLEMLEDPAL